MNCIAAQCCIVCGVKIAVIVLRNLRGGVACHVSVTRKKESEKEGERRRELLVFRCGKEEGGGAEMGNVACLIRQRW